MLRGACRNTWNRDVQPMRGLIPIGSASRGSTSMSISRPVSTANVAFVMMPSVTLHALWSTNSDFRKAEMKSPGSHKHADPQRDLIRPAGTHSKRQIVLESTERTTCTSSHHPPPERNHAALDATTAERTPLADTQDGRKQDHHVKTID